MAAALSYNVDPNSRTGRILLNVFIGIGLALIAAALIVYSVLASRTARYVKTEGVITGFAHGSYPIVEYEANGEKYTFEPSISSDLFRVGKPYAVRYDPAEPQNAVSAGFNRYFAPILLLFIGSTFAGISLLIKLVARRKAEDDR